MSPQWRRRAKCKSAAAQVEPAGMTTAVSILRVSTKRQLNEGEGIENQRRGNNAYIARKRYKLHKEFVLAESASEEKRTDFDEVLAYLVAHRKEVQVALFWKLDRISRGGVGAYYALKAHLARYGIRIEFATENIDASPSGELMESILAATARFENRLRVDRTIGAEKIITRDGYWCRGAPLGFKNGRDTNGKPTLVPDPESWQLLQEGLRMQLSGQYRISEVVAWLKERGLRSKHGKEIIHARWEEIIRNPVYGGFLQEAWTDGERIRAKFDGPLTPDEWERLQDVLNGGKAPALRRSPKALHEELPLRHFLRCPNCDGPTRGYPVVKKNGLKFLYYDCKNRACRFRVPAAKAHSLFVDYLGSLRPEPEVLEAFRLAVLERWHQESETRRRESRARQKSVTELAREKDSLIELMRRVGSNPSILVTLQEQYEQLDRQLVVATSDRDVAEVLEYEAQEVVNHCLHFIEHANELWTNWPVEAKSRLQAMLFPQGLSHAVLEGKQTGFLSEIHVQMAILARGEKMVAQTGIEPVTPPSSGECSTS